MQVLSAGEARFKNGPAKVVDGEILSQQDPEFCAQTPGPGETRPGFCPGVDNSKKDGSNFTGGKWFFTVNGQVFPRIPVRSEAGEIWRLTNASGSVSYHLQLVDDGLKKPLVMQLIAVDGVTISLPQDTPKDTVVKLAGARFKTTPCQTAHTEIQSLPVCVTDLVMMPSSRAEVWVAYRDAAGGVTTQPAKATATLKTVGLTMGSGDAWPAVDLARVAFAQARTAPTDAAVIVQGDASKMAAEGGIFSAPAPDARARPLPAGCKALPAGHRRRIFFGLEDLKDEDSFGLGYEEVDEHGAPVPGTRLSVSRFDPSRPSVCLPLGPGQTPVHETWELVQLSTENHNFHIHQTKFRTVFSSRHGPSGMLGPTGFRIPQDNLPLGVAEPDASISKKVMDKQSGVCSVKQWRDGFCHSKPVVLDVPFSKVGDFVYHCHILEHEDGGMMAKIRVVPFPK